MPKTMYSETLHEPNASECSTDKLSSELAAPETILGHVTQVTWLPTGAFSDDPNGDDA